VAGHFLAGATSHSCFEGTVSGGGVAKTIFPLENDKRGNVEGVTE